MNPERTTGPGAGDTACPATVVVEALVVLWREGLTSGEVAERTGLTRSAVIGRLNRAGEIGKMPKAEKSRRLRVGEHNRRFAGSSGLLSFGA